MSPRVRYRLPIWSALLIVSGAYVARSVMRGFDFRLDLPLDPVVLAGVVVVFALVAWVRADDARRDDGAPPDEHQEPEG